MKLRALVYILLGASFVACGSPPSNDSKSPVVESSDQQEDDPAYEGSASVAVSTSIRGVPALSSPPLSIDGTPISIKSGDFVLIQSSAYDAESGTTFGDIGFGWVDMSLLQAKASCNKRFNGPYARVVENRYFLSILSLIAYGEGTGNCYHYMFGYKTFSSYKTHPNQCQPFGNNCSTAAGRYQFLKKTWDLVKVGIKAPNFEPSYQDLGAKYLIESRGFRNASERLNATQFRVGMTQISWEWASLPPGQYGQPTKSLEVLWRRYQEWTLTAP